MPPKERSLTLEVLILDYLHTMLIQFYWVGWCKGTKKKQELGVGSQEISVSKDKKS